MTPCLDYILDLEEPQQSIMLHLHTLLEEFPDLQCRRSYGIPFFYRKKWICYLNPTKDGGVEIGFPRGWELSNEQGVLEDRGRKQVRGIVFRKISDIPEETLLEIVQEAILLDESTVSKSGRKPKR
ncbi:MAG: DUF1801 domain-containing protein [Lewinellaceae bacterium]|nr:DUF1801 domain-containing protein [Lewinellaceae bacterium]